MKGCITTALLFTMASANAQNVGIGTQTPTAPLEVVGRIKTTSLQITQDAGFEKVLASEADGTARWIEPFWRTAPNSGTIRSGNVGIGEITNPQFAMHIVRPSAGYVTVMRLETNTVNQGVGLELYSPVTQGFTQNAFRLKANGQYFRISSLSLANQIEHNLITVTPKTGLAYTEGAFVGINMLDGSLPRAPLHVKGTSNVSQPTNIRYFNYLTNPTITNNWQGSTAIFAEGNICATEAFISAQSFTFSDKRLKKILGKSNSREDLEKLKQIEVTRYQAADTILAGDKIFTKVVAQQVEEIIPEAVGKARGFLPDIMQVSAAVTTDRENNQTTIVLGNEHRLAAGDRVRVINEKGKEFITSVKEVSSPESFVIDGTDAATQKVFVYGKEVPDVKMVDYEAISMLNVSATQQLAKELEETRRQLEILKQQMKELHQMVNR